MADKAFMSFTQNGEQVGLGHSLLVGGDTMEYRALVSDVAKKIIEDYAGSTLAGSAQSVQSALASLNSNFASTSLSRFLANSSGATINFPTNYRGILFTIDSATDRLGLYFMIRGSSGSVILTAVRAATALTFDNSTAGTLIIKSPGATACLIWNVSGKVS